MNDNDVGRILIFTGHYGSGKTEIALNFALQCPDGHRETTLLDLDFVNPYFRSREARTILAESGIKVVASTEDYFDTDLPALSRSISGVLQNQEVRVIVDLGGNETGARAIGRFRHHIQDEQYQMLLVLNPFRPFTSGPNEVRSLMGLIASTSRLKVSAVVSNPNLLQETTAEDIISGHQTVLEIAQSLDLPVQFLAVDEARGRDPRVRELGLPVLQLSRHMVVPWELT